jgi:hypothetical protein
MLKDGGYGPDRILKQPFQAPLKVRGKVHKILKQISIDILNVIYIGTLKSSPILLGINPLS